MRPQVLSLLACLVFGLTACNSVSRNIKTEAHDFSQHVAATIQPDSESARQKLSEAETTARQPALTAQVKARLASEAGLNTVTGIAVGTTAGVVTLSGTVTSQAQRKAAETAASQVAGVTAVRNHLRIQP